MFAPVELHGLQSTLHEFFFQISAFILIFCLHLVALQHSNLVSCLFWWCHCTISLRKAMFARLHCTAAIHDTVLSVNVIITLASVAGERIIISTSSFWLRVYKVNFYWSEKMDFTAAEWLWNIHAMTFVHIAWMFHNHSCLQQ